MSKTMNVFFREQGYRLFSMSKDMQSGVFIQEETCSVNAICMMKVTQNGAMLESMVSYFIEMQKKLLADRGASEIHILAILVSAESEEVRKFCKTQGNYWYYNISSSQLEIDEEQFPDFYGIKGPITEHFHSNGISFDQPMMQTPPRPLVPMGPPPRPYSPLDQQIRKPMPMQSRMVTPPNPYGQQYVYAPIPPKKIDRYTYTSIPQDQVLGRKKFFPWMTIALIVVNTIIFLLSFCTDVIPVDEWILDENILGDFTQFYRLVSYMFLHANFEHLFGNMTTLYIAGVLAERYFGRVKYLIIYLITGIIGGGGSIIFYLLIDADEVGTVGASGAIMGILGALIIMLLTNGKIGSQKISVWRVIVVVLFLIYINTPSGEGNINYACHIIGLVIGVLTALLFLLMDTLKKKK